ncbi:uncharacterized protein LOC144443030 [Glandiceps talaboti]
MHNYLITDSRSDSNGRYRRQTGRGNAMKEVMCDSVIPIPADVKKSLKLSDFYKKYTHAFGVPIISSGKVSDKALKHTCYIVRVMLSDRDDIRNSMYDNYGRVGIISINENTTDIPEHSFLDSYYDLRARGLGGTTFAPISTVGEENVLCLDYPRDPYHDEDILVHEFAHGIHRLGIEPIDKEFTPKLMATYEESVLKRGLWNRTYASVNFYEYFAKAVQCYFNVNGVPFLGLDNHVNTRIELKKYDKKLYDLVRQVFPCGNQVVDRCYDADCINNANVSKMCDEWFDWGECDRNPKYMINHCQSSCKTCDHGGYGIPGQKIRRNCVYRPSSVKSDNTNKVVVKNKDKDKKKNRNKLKKLKKLKKTDLNSKGAIKLRKGKEENKQREEKTKLAKSKIDAKKKEKKTEPIQPTIKPACQDSHIDCTTWAGNGGCDTNAHMLLHLCQKSCDMCEAVRYCTDFYEDCVDWADSNQCYANPTFTWRYCRKSCNVCKACSDKDEQCPEWAKAGQCDSDNAKMNEVCPLSCGFCEQRLY